MAQVEIYTKLMCGYCTRAKRLLEMKRIEFEEYPVDFGGPKKAEMIKRAGGRMTVPQIFINGRHVGGCDELVALDGRGGLVPLLKGAPA